MKYPGTESSKLEFKEGLPTNAKIIKTVIAFCNMHGGKIVYGVNNSGTIIGVDEADAHKVMEWLDKAIYDECTPPIIPLIYQQRIAGKLVLVIEISPGMNKPYYRKSYGLEKGTYMRLGRSSVKVKEDMIEELKWQSRGLSFDKMPVYRATKDDIDVTQIEKFLTNRKNGAKFIVSEKMMLSYNILTREHDKTFPSVAGLITFGLNPQKFLTEAYILCSHFSGLKGREAIATRNCTGTIIEQYDNAYNFILSRLNKSYKIVDSIREENYEIPPVAIREVLMNTLLHRNYHLNAPIKIAIYDDRVEFFSPGVFPSAIEINDLESGITYTRNPVIAKILWEAGYIEKMGSGFITLFDSYRNAGLAMPEVIEGTNYVKCILPRYKMIEDQSQNEIRILRLFNSHNELSRANIVTQLNIPRATVGRLLSSLVKDGKLQRLGSGRSTKYRKSKL